MLQVLAKYKTLAAVAALEEFTVEDLVRYSDVKPATVHSVLSRSDRYVEVLDEIPTGKRGGRPKRYRVRPDKAEELLAEVRQIEEGFGGGHLTKPVGDQLAAVTVAEGALFRAALESTDAAERGRLVELASLTLESAEAAAACSDTSVLSEVSLRHRAASALLSAVEYDMGAAALEKLAVPLSPHVEPLVSRAKAAMVALGAISDLPVVQSYAEAFKHTQALRNVPVHELLPTLAPQVVLVDAGDSEPERLSDFAESILHAFADSEHPRVVHCVKRAADEDELVRFDPTRTVSAISGNLESVVRSMLGVIAFRGSRARLRDTLAMVDDVCGAIPPRVVLTTKFNQALSDEAYAHSAGYVVMANPTPERLLGALGWGSPARCLQQPTGSATSGYPVVTEGLVSGFPSPKRLA